jgi:hypothetical protein
VHGDVGLELGRGALECVVSFDGAIAALDLEAVDIRPGVPYGQAIGGAGVPIIYGLEFFA